MSIKDRPACRQTGHVCSYGGEAIENRYHWSSRALNACRA
jgi:hypothetical protein